MSKIETKIAEMLQLQDEMNAKVNPQWRHADYPWYRAVWTECAELMDHHGWKWWKRQEPDTNQIKLELVDIWHFGLSMMLCRYEYKSQSAKQLSDTWQQHDLDLDFLRAVERLSSKALALRRFDAEVFFDMMAKVDMGMDELHRLYVGKNVLNFFRQDHGYKTGEYIKVWMGREDNEHLTDILLALPSDITDLRSHVYEQLATRYPGAKHDNA